MKYLRLNDPMVRNGLSDFLSSYYPRHDCYQEIRLTSLDTYHTITADLLLADGSSLIGIEIKSDRDTLTRFELQRPVYEANCTELWLVIGEKHLLTCQRILPWHWGLVVVYDGGDQLVAEVVREPSRNPGLDLPALQQFATRLSTLEPTYVMPTPASLSQEDLVSDIHALLPAHKRTYFTDAI